jgi:hypothetical protein
VWFFVAFYKNEYPEKGALPVAGYIKATYFSALKINNSKRINAIYLKILFNASQCIFIIF